MLTPLSRFLKLTPFPCGTPTRAAVRQAGPVTAGGGSWQDGPLRARLLARSVTREGAGWALGGQRARAARCVCKAGGWSGELARLISYEATQCSHLHTLSSARKFPRLL